MIITELRTSTWFRHPFSSSSQSLGTHGLHAFGDWGTYVFVFIYTGPQNSQFASFFFFHFESKASIGKNCVFVGARSPPHSPAEPGLHAGLTHGMTCVVAAERHRSCGVLLLLSLALLWCARPSKTSSMTLQHIPAQPLLSSSRVSRGPACPSPRVSELFLSREEIFLCGWNGCSPIPNSQTS